MGGLQERNYTQPLHQKQRYSIPPVARVKDKSDVINYPSNPSGKAAAWEPKSKWNYVEMELLNE